MRPGRSTVNVVEVKGHATHEMVRDGRVRNEDQEDSAAADDAVDLGRGRQLEHHGCWATTTQYFGIMLFVTCIVFDLGGWNCCQQ